MEIRLYLNSKTSSTIDTLTAIGICFEDVPMIVAEIDQRSLVHGSKDTRLEKLRGR